MSGSSIVFVRDAHNAWLNRIRDLREQIEASSNALGLKGYAVGARKGGMTERAAVDVSKLDVATRQLERALGLFLDEDDLISSITLAGAAEEILGKLLEKQGKKSTHGEFAEGCVEVGKRVFGEEWPAKHFSEMATYFRNGLKHYGQGETLTVPRDASIEILDRAIENYWKLLAEETALMRRFMEEVHGL